MNLDFDTLDNKLSSVQEYVDNFCKGVYLSGEETDALQRISAAIEEWFDLSEDRDYDPDDGDEF